MTRIRLHIQRTLVAFAWLMLTGLALGAASPFGRFVGDVDTRWLKDGRRMELLADFRFIDPDEVVWDAPKGSVIDGASIPQIAWSFVGGPYEDRYRPASVIHDVACDRKQRPWDAVHLAFYRAMRTGGVGTTKAKIMYAAVYHFGPRWPQEVVAVVPATEVTKVSDSLRAELALRGSVQLVVRDHYIEGVGASGQPEKLPSGMKELTARVEPPVSSITPDDFAKLQARIRNSELSLEDIRNAPAATPRRVK